MNWILQSSGTTPPRYLRDYRHGSERRWTCDVREAEKFLRAIDAIEMAQRLSWEHKEPIEAVNVPCGNGWTPEAFRDMADHMRDVIDTQRRYYGEPELDMECGKVTLNKQYQEGIVLPPSPLACAAQHCLDYARGGPFCARHAEIIGAADSMAAAASARAMMITNEQIDEAAGHRAVRDALNEAAAAFSPDDDDEPTMYFTRTI